MVLRSRRQQQRASSSVKTGRTPWVDVQRPDGHPCAFMSATLIEEPC